LLIKLDKSIKPNTFCKVIHHGGDEGVTGSCHEFFFDDQQSFLVDCGLFQGDEAKADLDHQVIDFDLSAVKAVLVTHVHIDHVGRLPYLLGAGYTGPIYCSAASAMLLPLVLEDAVKVGFSASPSMVKSILKRLNTQLVPVETMSWTTLDSFTGGKLKVKFKPAGHIMGSCYIEVDVKKADHHERTVFSGDLGAPYAPLLPAPRSPYACDRLIIESTYGDREHEGRAQRRRTLKTVLERALANRGTVIVPAFSIGRTQELLYEIESIIHQNRERWASRGLPWEHLDVVVDSPLANKFTEVYKKLKPLWDKEALRRVASGRHPLSFEQLTTVNTHRDHQKCLSYLKRTERPAIVLAASGMCAGGRVVNYLKAMIENDAHDVLFVGYQAHGTPGRVIQRYGPRGGYVDLDGRRYNIKAKVWTISGYSAHADQSDLVNFAKRMRHTPKLIKLIHGDEGAKRGLAKAYREALL
jgi:metallo-beta-lactamase family protein